MNLTTTMLDDVAVLGIDGRFTASGAPLLRNAVTDLVAAGTLKIVVDLSRVEFIDSSGLGALVGGLKSTRVVGGDLRISGVPENVRKVLSLTNLDRVLRNFPTAKEAFDGA
jgi:anti-sigma B factor antagonist